MTDILNVSRLNVKYDKIQALWEISFTVREKEVVSVLGPNGAGKTSLVHAIVGLVIPVSGDIVFRGARMNGTPPHLSAKKGIALIPEGKRLFPQMTVKENLLLGAYGRQARKSLADNFDRVLEIFPRLRERRNQKAGTLSGGEGQMVAIGRGLMSNPQLLILDEPSTGLAPLLISNMFEAIQTIKERGMTILLVEQNVMHALEISNRAVILENGRVTLEGDAREILSQTDLSKFYFGEV
jgi:branched-chain amino acid transport system ATP-binding protein